ncbi:MAG: flagellar biosynthesis protein FlhB [Alphaproteobacteria bacterium]|jgi:flagellar biosynthetic protein FlhB|nr:flagellar biosynthesis protein FlhB [Alphaproteobacteria bacterium]
MAEQQEATERTEDPTPKRLDEAVKRGDVAKSQEVNTWFITAGATLILLSFSDKMGSGLQTTLRGFLANAHSITVDGRGLINVTGKLGADILAVLAIPFLILVIAAIAGNMVQHRLVWSSEALMPKLSKVSPAAGFKRLFSKQALVNFAKGLIKVALIGTVMTALLWPQRHRLAGLVMVDPTLILPFTKSLSLSMMGAVVAILAIVAAADYLFQYRVWFERQKMSLRELKEEFKQTEGDPAIKGKIRQIRYARMRKRMMAAVPKASVVITNPTHYAIALKYERGMNAPICLAKGVEAVALKIREVAGKHSIPIVENAPLARALYATVELDKEIPPEHYKAVAEVIGYVMRLRRAVFR